MQNKRLVLGVLVGLVSAAAAYIAGRFLDQRVSSVGSISVSIIPAPELPLTPAEVTGPFIERQDNTIIFETNWLDTGGMVAPSSRDSKRQSGPRVEVVVTSETMVYRETTQISEPLSDENQIIQQTIQEAALDGLNAESMVIVWGRKSGDRIIAEVLMYSHTVMIKRGIFEDCETCP